VRRPTRDEHLAAMVTPGSRKVVNLDGELLSSALQASSWLAGSCELVGIGVDVWVERLVP
jgi:hypothetical protein